MKSISDTLFAFDSVAFPAPSHERGLINPVYMGDYDSLAGDFTLTYEGFVGAYSRIGPVANPDVRAVQLRH